MSAKRFEGKRVIVSGCFSGMGEAAARILLDEGAEVHGFDYRDCALPLAWFHKVDLRDPRSIEAGVEALEGPFDALYNCAGLPQGAPSRDVMGVNFLGTRHLTEQLVPRIREGGSVTSIASTGGLGWSMRLPLLMELAAQPGFDAGMRWCEDHADAVSSGYVFSKEALIVWTMVQSYHLIRRGVRINCTMPGPTLTPMMAHFEANTPPGMLEAGTQPINRMASPAEQAAPLVFLGSSDASFMNGVTLPVDGGFTAGLATGQISYGSLTGEGAAS